MKPIYFQVLFSESGLPMVPEKGLELLTDSFLLERSNVGTLSVGAIYSDANVIRVSGCRIGRILHNAFDASVRRFEFVANTVDYMETNAMSVACLHGSIVANTFKNQVIKENHDYINSSI